MTTEEVVNKLEELGFKHKLSDDTYNPFLYIISNFWDVNRNNISIVYFYLHPNGGYTFSYQSGVDGFGLITGNKITYLGEMDIPSMIVLYK